MRKLFQSFMAAAVLATGVVTFSAPQAEAQSFRERQRSSSASAPATRCARLPRLPPRRPSLGRPPLQSLVPRELS